MPVGASAQLPRIAPIGGNAALFWMRFGRCFIRRGRPDIGAGRPLRRRTWGQRGHLTAFGVQFCQLRPEGVQFAQVDQLTLIIALNSRQIHRVTGSSDGAPEFIGGRPPCLRPRSGRGGGTRSVSCFAHVFLGSISGAQMQASVEPNRTKTR